MMNERGVSSTMGLVLWTAMVIAVSAAAADEGSAPETAVNALARLKIHSTAPGARDDLKETAVFISPDGYLITSVRPLQYFHDCCSSGASTRGCSDLHFAAAAVTRPQAMPLDAQLIGCSASQGLALLHVRSRPQAWLGHPEAGAPNEASSAWLVSGSDVVKVSLAAGTRPGRPELVVPEDGGGPGMPVVGPRGNLVAIVESVEEGIPAASRRAVLVGRDDVTRFLNRFWFRVMFLPPVLDPQLGVLRVSVEPMLRELTGVHGTVRLEAEGISALEAALEGKPAHMSAELGLPAAWKDEPPEAATVSVVLREASSRVVSERRYRLHAAKREKFAAVTGSTSAGRRTPVSGSVGTAGDTSGANSSSLGAAGRLRLPDGDHGSKIAITDQVVRDIARHRLIGKNYEQLPLGPLRSTAERFDRLGIDQEQTTDQLSEVVVEVRSATSYREYWSAVERYYEIRNRLQDVSREVKRLESNLQTSGICRCPSGVWYLRTKSECGSNCRITRPSSGRRRR